MITYAVEYVFKKYWVMGTVVGDDHPRYTPGTRFVAGICDTEASAQALCERLGQSA